MKVKITVKKKSTIQSQDTTAMKIVQSSEMIETKRNHPTVTIKDNAKTNCKKQLLTMTILTKIKRKLKKAKGIPVRPRAMFHIEDCK